MKKYLNSIIAENQPKINPDKVFSLETVNECPVCGSSKQRILPTEITSPHAGRLECAQCEKYIKWIGKAELARILGGAA